MEEWDRKKYFWNYT